MTTRDEHASDPADAPPHTDSKGKGVAGNARKHGLTASKQFSEAEKARIDARLADPDRHHERRQSLGGRCDTPDPPL